MENAMTEDLISRAVAIRDFDACNAYGPEWTPQRVKQLLVRQPPVYAMPEGIDSFDKAAELEKHLREFARTKECEAQCGLSRVLKEAADMYKVACSRKEASCIIGSLLVELAPVCEKCGGLPDGVLNLQTEAGLSLTGDADVLITGHSIISGKPVRIKLTDYGFEYYGDRAELARVREKRCVYHGRAVSPTKEN